MLETLTRDSVAHKILNISNGSKGMESGQRLVGNKKGLSESWGWGCVEQTRLMWSKNVQNRLYTSFETVKKYFNHSTKLRVEPATSLPLSFTVIKIIDTPFASSLFLISLNFVPSCFSSIFFLLFGCFLFYYYSNFLFCFSSHHPSPLFFHYN